MQMAGEVYDVCVIGAGIEGSSTARYLASRRKKTLLLEQVWKHGLFSELACCVGRLVSCVYIFQEFVPQ